MNFSVLYDCIKFCTKTSFYVSALKTNQPTYLNIYRCLSKLECKLQSYEIVNASKLHYNLVYNRIILIKSIFILKVRSLKKYSTYFCVFLQNFTKIHITAHNCFHLMNCNWTIISQTKNTKSHSNSVVMLRIDFYRI